MAFVLGNFSIDEIIEAVAEDFEGNLLYTLDQLSQASIEISSEKQDITDKNGNIVRSIYASKTGTFNSQNAFLHPQIMNATTGSKIVNASSTAPITAAPKIVLLAAGATEYVLGAGATVTDDSIQVIGIFGNGANSKVLTAAASGGSASFDPDTLTGTYVYDEAANKITVPAGGTGKPTTYLVKFDRSYTSGIKITNNVKAFPDTVKLTLYCSYVDPCDDSLKALYVVLPSFQASPETTIQLQRGEQTMDFNGDIQTDYCGADQTLYIIYIPDENAVKTGIVTTP